MAKFNNATEATMVGYFNAGDQPTEAQFTALMAAIQAGIDEHDHAGVLPGDGMLVPLNSLTPPGAAGRAIVSTAAGAAWDATPTWTGLHLFNAGTRSPAQPAFSAHMNGGDQSFNVGTTTLEFDTEVFDQGGDFTVGTYTFTAPITGVYLLKAYVRVDAIDSAATYYRLEIITGNRTYASMIDPRQLAGDPSYWPMEVTAIADMDAADTAYVRIAQSGGANQSSIEGGEDYSRFMGWFLG